MLLMASGVQAALVDRGGGLIYDDVQDVTWLQDANYAQTNGDDADGLMSWTDATAWAAGLVYTNSAGTYSDWRLPTTIQPDASCAGQSDPGGGFPLQGFGLDCTGSEMGHLNNVDGISVGAAGLFTNLQFGLYWSDSEYAPNLNSAWLFDFGSIAGGAQGTGSKVDLNRAWAVRSGDVAAIPLPAGLWLLGSALGPLGWMRATSSVTAVGKSTSGTRFGGFLFPRI